MLAVWSVTMVWDLGVLSDFRLLLNTGRGRELPRRTVISNKSFNSGELFEIRQNDTHFILCLLRFNRQEIIMFNSETISWHCYCWMWQFLCPPHGRTSMRSTWNNPAQNPGGLQTQDCMFKCMFMLHMKIQLPPQSKRQFILEVNVSGQVVVS